MSVAVFTLVLVVIAGLGFLGWKLLVPSKFNMEGTLVLTDTNIVDSGTCRGSGGYADIVPGTSVTVYNADGKIVGVGDLRDGAALGDHMCWFAFTVEGVPGGDGPYQYEISHRGRLTISEDDARNGKVSATLGSAI